MKNQSALIARLTACGIVAACGAAAHAQYFERLFGTEDGETPRGIALCANDDIITTGFRQVGGMPRTYASRHRSDGALLWAWDYPEASASTGWSAVEAFNGDVLVAGSTTMAGPNLRLSLMRLNPLGGISWAAVYASTGFEASDVFIGPRKNVAVEEVLDIGFAAVTSEDRPGFAGLTQALMLMVTGNGAPVFQKSYITSISFPPVGISFNDLRLDTASPNLGIVVTGTVQFEPIPGSGGTTTREALYARFDLAGNPLAAYSYRIQTAAGGPSFDIFGDGIEVTPGGDVVIMGRTNAFGPAFDDAAAIRVTPAGAVVWARTIRGIAPASAAMSRSDERVIACAGEVVAAAGLPGNIGLIGVNEVGAHVFSRAFSQTSPGLSSLGRDQVWFGGDSAGWAVVGDETEPYSFGGRDIDLLRTDRFARTGCEEREVAASVEVPLVQVRELTLFQSTRNEWTARTIVPVDPKFLDQTVCAGNCPCPGDANGDSVVDFSDMDAALANWSANYAPGTGPGDANCDGVVNFDDINAVIGAWGMVCP